MCWISYIKPQRHIAEKDITVYKLMDCVYDDYCRSLMMGFKYKYNTLYSIPFLTVTKERSGHPRYKDIYVIREGFHSYIEGTLGVNSMGTLKCIIPKGSEYYIYKDEIVSNQIIINKI